MTRLQNKPMKVHLTFLAVEPLGFPVLVDGLN